MSRDLDDLLVKLAATPRQRPPLHAFTGTRRFELRRRLGGGGFGEVWEARDRERGAIVALKALRSSHPEWIFRFKREFRLVGELSHPNIVRVYELFGEDDRWYLTMELLDALPFDAYLERRPSELRPAFAQLARGLAALHAAGCLHRDVKPSNALVEATGRVVLVDFGLSIEHDEARHTPLAGTAPFMAPELAAGALPSEASDWYAFGVMLYAALAGALPFGGTTEELKQRSPARPPPLPSARRAHDAPELEALAMRLVAAAPEARPTGEEVHDVLGLALSRRLARVDAHGPVVGRERELAAIDGALAAVDPRAPAVLELSGEAGIGKSVLLAALATRARQRGLSVFGGRCHEAEVVPYKGLDQVIDALTAELLTRPEAEQAAIVPADADALAQMFPVLKQVAAFAGARRDAPTGSPQDLRRRAARALRELWRRIGRGRPVVVIVDDLHWCNEDGAQLIVELLAAPMPPILAVLAYRPQPPGAAPPLEWVLDAARQPGLARTALAIGPLDAGGVSAFLAAIPSGANGPSRTLSPEQALRDTGGHPFLLARLTGAEARAGEGLAGEIAALEPAARQLLEVVALAAVPIDEPTAFAALGEPVDPGLFDVLRRRRLLMRRAGAEDGSIVTYHDRVREAAVAGIDEARRRALHLGLAAVLATRGRLDPEALAHHFRHSGERRAGLSWSRRAARAASEALAFARAERLLQDAQELCDDDATRLAVLSELAEARVQSGRRTAAAETFEAAAEVAARLGRADVAGTLRARAGSSYLVAGHHERGFALTGELLAELAPRAPTTPAEAVAGTFNVFTELAARGLEHTPRAADTIDPARLRRLDLALELAIALSNADLRAPWVAGVALREALELGEPDRLLRALALFVLNLAASHPDHEFVVEARRRLMASAAASDDELGVAYAGLADLLVAAHRWDLNHALAMCPEVERRFLALGSIEAREVAVARFLVTLLCGSLGMDPPRAFRVAPELFAEVSARGDRYTANWLRVAMVWLALFADDLSAARAHVAEARRGWGERDSIHNAMLSTSEMIVDVYEAPAEAWARLQPALAPYHAQFSSLLPAARFLIARITAFAALAAVDAGRLGRAEAIAALDQHLELIAQHEGHQSHSLLIGALRRGLEGDRAGYLADMERLSTMWAELGQKVNALCAALRVRQVRGDLAGERAVEVQLRALEVVKPDRTATVFAGTRPRFATGPGR